MSARKVSYDEVIADTYRKLIRPPRKMATKLVVDGMELRTSGPIGISVRVRDLILGFPRLRISSFMRAYVANLNLVRNHFRLRWQIATERLTTEDFNELTQRLVLERMSVVSIICFDAKLDDEDLQDSHVRKITLAFLSTKFGLNDRMVETVASRLLGCDRVEFRSSARTNNSAKRVRSPESARWRISD